MGNVTGPNKDTENPAAKLGGINKVRGPRESTTSHTHLQAFFWALDVSSHQLGSSCTSSLQTGKGTSQNHPFCSWCPPSTPLSFLLAVWDQGTRLENALNSWSQLSHFWGITANTFPKKRRCFLDSWTDPNKLHYIVSALPHPLQWQLVKYIVLKLCFSK